LTGQDIISQLRGRPLGEFLLVPDVMLKEGEDVFLDDLSLLDLERELGVRVSKVSSTPWGILEGIEDLAADFRQDPDPDRK
jgi:NifB/MoaA-like Fe-S oxidoreductase